MKRRILLKKTMTMARTGDADSFQSFYILTVEETYGKAYALVKDQKQAEDLLTDVYLSLYRQVHTLPVEEEDLVYRIEEEIYRMAEKRLGLELGQRADMPESYEKLPEERAATLWMRIEERAGFSGEEPEDDMSWKSYLQSGVRIAGAVGALVLTAVVLFQGWQHLILPAREEAAASAQVQETVEETAVQEVVIEEEKETPGWRQTPDKKLVYIGQDGIPADGEISIGKQVMTFSKEGELTLIGSSLDVAENRNLSFDEDTRYEVKNGDVYQMTADGEESCVIRNGHVIQADVRCGYLWYICEYQIPNSEQIKMTVSRALPDGEQEEEVYSTNKILETGSFQVTSRWYYYLSDGRLFRKNLESDRTEFLAKDVAHYFAWEDTAYYMKDRALETVSVGRAYSGVEAGYQIEKTEQGFVLLNGIGDAVPESGSGEIQVGDRIYRVEGGTIRSVSPAVRKDGTVTYYIETSSSDRKIYWKDTAGTRGLVPQEGLTADSFCIAGEWLYYSARTAQYGAECQSQIYRINLRTSQTETVGSPFRGLMRNLYYFDNVQTIYGEYISSVVDPESIHGSIAKISVDQMGVVNDKAVRPDSDGSDMLELVMANENRIFCLYHKCTYDAVSGQMAWTSTEALEIELPGSR